MACNGDASGGTDVPSAGDTPTLESQGHVDEHWPVDDIEKTRLIEAVLDGGSSNMYSNHSHKYQSMNGNTTPNQPSSQVDWGRSPSHTQCGQPHTQRHLPPTSSSMNGEEHARLEATRDTYRLTPISQPLSTTSPSTGTSVNALPRTGIIANGSAVEALSSPTDVCRESNIGQTVISDVKSSSAVVSLILRRSEWNCDESTCANDRQVNEYLNEAENATSSSVIAQYITRTSTLCSRRSQQERKVDSSTVADAGHMTAEKATECVILNRPTVDQCCETAKPDTRDVSVQTSAEIQHPETGTTFDHQPRVFIAPQSSIAPSKVESPTEMLTQTLNDADAKSGQNERTGHLVETRKTADQGVIVQSSTRPFKAKSPAEMLTQTFDDADTKSERDKEFGHLVETGKTHDQCVIVQSSVTPPNVTVVKSEIGQLVEHCRTIFTEGVNEIKVAVENTSLSQTDTVPAARISFTPPGNEGTQHESLCLPGDHRAAVVAGRPVCLLSPKEELSSTVAISPSLETAQDEKVQSLSLVSRLRHRLRDKLKSIQSS